MKKMTNSLGIKIGAFLLFVVFIIAFAGSLFGICILEGNNVYNDGGKTLHQNMAISYINSNLWEVYQAYEGVYYFNNANQEDESVQEEKRIIENSILDRYNENVSNFMFQICDENGNELLSNYSGESYRYKNTQTYTFDRINNEMQSQLKTFYDYESICQYINKMENQKSVESIQWQIKVRVDGENGDSAWVIYDEGEGYPYYFEEVYYDNYGDGYELLEQGRLEIQCHIMYYDYTVYNTTVTGYVRQNLTADDYYSDSLKLIQFAVDAKNAAVAICITSFILAVVVFIFMICSAGHCAGHDGIYLYWTDRVPFDLFAAILIVACLLGCMLTVELLSNYDELVSLCIAAVSGCAILLTASFGGLTVTFAARAKAGKWWHNTIIYKVLRFVYRVLRKSCRVIVYAISKLPMYWKVALGWVALSVFELIYIAASWSRVGVIGWWIFEKFLLTVFIGFVVYGMNKLKKGGQALADGNLSAQIDTRVLFFDFKQHAENLNSISAGMSKAVDERMKSERMKTELITNVSHDIKTPLTSIVNYVDLIKKEDVQPEKVKEYIDVLDRQSARLKKLIEDLVEASKASTGNISVNMQPTDVGVLLNQAVGEYEQKLTNAGLMPVLDLPETPVMIMADGRHLWRVFDNLLSNICKYAMPNTRVYMSCSAENGEAVVTFKNVSATQLNISADELFERFTRGDASRHTEGSGLGLSIARSLMQLQNGKIDIVVDGDLFKAVLRFKLQ